MSLGFKTNVPIPGASAKKKRGRKPSSMGQAILHLQATGENVSHLFDDTNVKKTSGKVRSHFYVAARRQGIKIGTRINHTTNEIVVFLKGNK